MPTLDLFREDATLRECAATVLRVDERELTIADKRKGKDEEALDILHCPAAGQEAPLATLSPGLGVTARVDWARRHAHMRFHTSTHLLSAPGRSQARIPQCVSTEGRPMSVQPPRGTGRVRLVNVEGVDLQPCGGTHVANTAEIGAAVVTKKKSAMTRRVVLGFAGA